ncbi:FABP family protein [Candidatus Poriferisodalis sp.]|uniref:FABP family protein n=1 Tax=Candidatus Poriferisodalis sp. TaxID=3101277 RepID=UPI003B01B13D
MPDLHPQCEPLALLLGTWQGGGTGHYPTIDDFAYTEELTFGHVGKPFVSMIQRTRNSVTGEPLHSEAGYIRALPGGELELTLAQPSGVTEIHLGTVRSSDDGLVIELRSEEVGMTPSAKEVTSVRRELSVVGLGTDGGPSLISELWMAAVGHGELLHHLRGELTKQN